jgi:MFS family permease
MLYTTLRMTPTQAVRAGLAQAGRNVWLVLLVWLVFLALAWVAALPAWRLWDRALSLAPEGDRLLGGLNVALLRELTHYDRSPTTAIAFGSAFTFFLFALILNPFIAGGILGKIESSGSTPTSDTPPRVRGLTQRFATDGIRLYWRFARIMLIVGILGVVVAMILMTGFEAVGGAFDERGWPRVSMWVDNVMLLAVAIVFGVSSLLLDVSRIFMLRRDDGRAAAAIRQALGFMRRNFGAVIAIGVVFVVLLIVAIAIYNLIASGITPLSWGLLIFTIVWQQAFALVRTMLRVGLLAALTTLVETRMPRPVEQPIDAAPADVTPADEPVYELPMLG